MTGTIAHVLARCTGTATCSRCTDVVDVAAGAWHAAEADTPQWAICDACAQRDDPAGYEALLAWRRASAQPATGRKGRS